MRVVYKKVKMERETFESRLERWREDSESVTSESSCMW
jgi:hypothetical protein